MNLREEISFDPLIWTPDILSMLIKRQEARGRLKMIIFSEKKYQNIIDIEPLKFVHEAEGLRLGRQAKPNDWLIYKRDQVLVQLAECWMRADGKRTPSDFCGDIFPVVASYHFQSKEDSLTSVFPQIKFIEDGKENGYRIVLVCGLLWCLSSMQSLATGEVEETVIALMKASSCLAKCASELDRIKFSQRQPADPISAASTAFSRSGTDAQHKDIRAVKAQARAHYAEKGHEPGYETKESSGFKLAEEFGVSPRTAGRWIVRLKPKHPKPAKVPR